MDKSSLKLAGAAIGGALVLFVLYLVSGLSLAPEGQSVGIVVNKVGGSFFRWVLLLAGAGCTLWVMGKMSQQINSGWFLPIILGAVFSVFAAWIFIATSTRPAEADVRLLKNGDFAPRTMKQFNGEEETPAAVETKAEVKAPESLSSVDAAKKEFDEIVSKYDFTEKYRSFDATINSESKVTEFVTAMLNSKNSKGEAIKVSDEDAFKIRNYFVQEFRKREESKSAPAAEPTSSADPAPAPEAPASEPATVEAPEAEPATAVTVASTEAGADDAALYKKKCAACHSLTANMGKMRQKHMKSDESALKLVQWMQKLAKNDRSKSISDDEAKKIAAFIRTPGAKLN
ncbi:MAG: photosystem P840 reaction-center cytochrome c-551 [Chloroherpetonaceae bacterium]|nr:photosystem P840 reaction-center cytochrome c-551 [Chloroherpetonaceae bacterium]